jgi:hypothetical protein
MLVDNNPNTREHKHYYGYVNDTDKWFSSSEDQLEV